MDEPGPEHFGDETALAAVTRVKEAAAIAFHKANHDLAVRAAALHRARVETEELNVGDYVYYWKPQTNKLDPFRWRGPSLVVWCWANLLDNLPRFTGSSMGHLCFDAPGNSFVWKQFPNAMSDNLNLTMHLLFDNRWNYACLQLYGPCGDPYEPSMLQPMVILLMMFPLFPIHLPRMLQNPSGYSTRLTLARNDAAEPLQPGGVWTDGTEEGPSEEVRQVIRSHPGLPDPGNPDSTMSDAQQGLLQQLQIHHPDVANPRHEISEKEEGSKEETEVARTNEKRLYEEAVRWAAQVSEDHNRTLDGLPRRSTTTPGRLNDGQAAPKQARTEEIHYVAMSEEEVMMAVTESRLSPEEKKKFVEAKRKSLVPWCENDAWRPAKRTQAPIGTIVPMRFLLRYKEDKPHARVILQGFKHRDVVQGKLDTESPTLSRLGKYLVVLVGCIKRWKFGTMDVKSAFLQSDYIHHKVQLYGEPSADMRSRSDEAWAGWMRVCEHATGEQARQGVWDLRAPRQEDGGRWCAWIACGRHLGSRRRSLKGWGCSWTPRRTDVLCWAAVRPAEPLQVWQRELWRQANLLWMSAHPGYGWSKRDVWPEQVHPPVEAFDNWEEQEEHDWREGNSQGAESSPWVARRIGLAG